MAIMKFSTILLTFAFLVAPTLGDNLRRLAACKICGTKGVDPVHPNRTIRLKGKDITCKKLYKKGDKGRIGPTLCTESFKKIVGSKCGCP
mmetsp:Transcript_5426/g.12046  ORF Transcript_5426/g.12046 Transcript_5426/m.12046 type:complete len:90 (-) Transcript_5426:36-305(-)